MKWILRRDGTEVFRGSLVECIHYIHTTHSYSLDHALKHEGYTLDPETPVAVPHLDYWPYVPTNPVAWKQMQPVFQKAKELWGDVGYVGHDGTHHYFQRWGDSTPYTLPIEGEIPCK